MAILNCLFSIGQGLGAVFAFAEGAGPYKTALGMVTNSILMYVVACLGVALSISGFVSAVGYIRRKRILGRMVGNLYGGLGVILVVLSATSHSSLLGGTLTASAHFFLVLIAYPVITLVVLNTIYRNTLVA